MIILKNISKTFASGKSHTRALKNINLTIKKGEFIALVGPSGSGKTTLLNLIGGLDTPNQGNITIDEQNITEQKDKKLSKFRNHDIGFIFQEFHLESMLSVKDNVLLPTYFNSQKQEKTEYAEKLIREVELSEKKDTLVNELSGGQKQRAAIARALINNPKIILADEPTGNLDIKTGETIINLLKKLHKKHGITMIIATHDQNIAKNANKIIHIIDGEIKPEPSNA